MAIQTIIYRSSPNHRKETPFVVTNTLFVSSREKYQTLEVISVDTNNKWLRYWVQREGLKCEKRTHLNTKSSINFEKKKEKRIEKIMTLTRMIVT